MNLEQIDGFLAALVCGPEEVSQSEYLSEIWGDIVNEDWTFIREAMAWLGQPDVPFGTGSSLQGKTSRTKCASTKLEPTPRPKGCIVVDALRGEECDLDHKAGFSKALQSSVRRRGRSRTPAMRTLILNSGFAILFCWGAAVVLVRRWLTPPKNSRNHSHP